MATISKTTQRKVRKNRIRANVKGSAERPRLAVFRSNRYIYAKVIDDSAQKTLASATSKGSKKVGIAGAVFVGEEIAKNAKAKKIQKVVFDRGGFIYTGHIKALAESARAGGLEF